MWNAQRRGEVLDAITNTCGHLGWPTQFLCDDFRNLAARKGLPRPMAGGSVRGYCDSLTAQQMVRLSDALDLQLEQMLDDQIDARVRGAA